MSDSANLPFDPEPIPRHIAIIMDGNGRWARARLRPRLFGHQAGAESVREIVRTCGEWGVEYLTLYAFSTENWKRPEEEVSGLMGLLERYLRKETKELDKSNVRLRAIGDVSRLPAKSRAALEESIAALDKNTGLTLVLALNYGGRDEMTRAVGAIAGKVARGEIAPEGIDEATIAAHLDTADFPDPDLMIRTAGEMRISNFLLWQLSYAELYSTDLCWPDFRRDALGEAIAAYQRRVRKFGRVVEPE